MLGFDGLESGGKMNVRIIAAGFAACLLCGCTDADWDHATTYVGLGPTQNDRPAPPASADAAPTSVATDQSAKSDSWCQQAAKSARDEAAGDGFDSATQQRRAESTYRQCVGYSSH